MNNLNSLITKILNAKNYSATQTINADNQTYTFETKFGGFENKTVIVLDNETDVKKLMGYSIISFLGKVSEKNVEKSITNSCTAINEFNKSNTFFKCYFTENILCLEHYGVCEISNLENMITLTIDNLEEDTNNIYSIKTSLGKALSKID